MTLTRIAFFLGLALQLGVATSALADCAVAKAPGKVPDGSSASIDEMNAAKSALDKYQNAVKEQLACLETETKAKIAELGSSVDSIRQVKLMAEKRSTVVQEELQARADEFTEQMRAWKLTNRQ
jgi:hypothetical protein